MDSEPRENLHIGSGGHREPEIGRWLWALQDTRRRTLRELAHVLPEQVDWQPSPAESSIGTVLYHMAAIEADWLYVEVLEQPMPPEIIDLFQTPIRDAQGRLGQVQNFTLDEHRQRLAAVRTRLLDAYAAMTLADFRRARALPQYDVTPEWVVHHLVQHEAEHRGQIGTLRAAAERRVNP